MGIFGLGAPELAVIAGVVLLIYGKTPSYYNTHGIKTISLFSVSTKLISSQYPDLSRLLLLSLQAQPSFPR
jgi:hypothetical protein